MLGPTACVADILKGRGGRGGRGGGTITAHTVIKSARNTRRRGS